jgi:polar amino acid transport system substrate-binding protein
MTQPDWQRSTVVAYLDEPPFFSPTSNGDPIGCDIELTNTVLGMLGADRIEFVLTTFGELIPGLLAGRWHVNTPIFITADRSHLIDFSLPVWAATDGFIVRAADPRDFSSYEVIAADDTIRVGVVAGQVQRSTASRVGVPAGRIVEFADQDTAVRAVIDGRVDASVSTAPGNAAYLRQATEPRLVAVTDSLAHQRGPVPFGAFSFRKQTSDLSAAFDDALRQYLGTPPHLEMMGRYGFTADELQPVLAALRRCP